MPDITNDFDNNPNTDKENSEMKKSIMTISNPNRQNPNPNCLNKRKAKNFQYRFLQSCMTGAILRLMSLI